MTIIIRRFGLGFGAALIALGTLAAVHASTQNTAGGAGSFMGRPRPMAGMGGGLASLRRIAGRLGLSDAQKDQIKNLIQSHRDEWKALADRSAAAHNALSQAVAADTIDERAIRQASAAVAEVQADVAVASAHARAAFFQVLTPEQRTQANEMQAQLRQRADRFRERLEKRSGAKQ